VNILKENNLDINVASILNDEFVIHDIVSIYPSSDNFADLDYPPCTFVPVDCCGSTSLSSVTIDACKILNNDDIEAKLHCKEN
jgi:hypothetical protein